MPMFVAGLLLLWLSSILLRGFLKANPAALSRRLRTTGGWLALGFGLVMLVRGQLNVAFGAVLLGGWLLGTRPGWIGNLFAAASPLGSAARRGAAPQVSQVRSMSVEMTLDRSTGAVSGRVLAGAAAGRFLDDLTEAECLSLLAWCAHVDPPGARLVETYLDRRFPTWRQTAHAGGDAGGTASGVGGQGATQMSERAAYDLLGLAQGADRDEITRAHRRLMKRYHPDHGGSTDMAARVNEAKDVLMRRHP